MTKEFRNCKIDLEGYDSKGVKVFTEKGIEAGTYRVKFGAPGEYKISFYNRDVRALKARESKSTSRSALSVTTVARSSRTRRKCTSTRTI
jgi:hypothetical protein